jgi:hypothetical protein
LQYDHIYVFIADNLIPMSIGYKIDFNILPKKIEEINYAKYYWSTHSCIHNGVRIILLKLHILCVHFYTLYFNSCKCDIYITILTILTEMGLGDCTCSNFPIDSKVIIPINVFL